MSDNVVCFDLRVRIPNIGHFYWENDEKGVKMDPKRVDFTKKVKTYIKGHIILLNMAWYYGTRTSFTETIGTNFIRVRINME